MVVTLEASTCSVSHMAQASWKFLQKAVRHGAQCFPKAQRLVPVQADAVSGHADLHGVPLMELEELPDLTRHYDPAQVIEPADDA